MKTNTQIPKCVMYTNSEIKKIRYTLFFYDYERHVNEQQS